MHAIRIAKRGSKINLDKISTLPPKSLEREQAEERMKALAADLSDLQELMWGARQHSVLVVLQGRDTAGKDGAIKQVVGTLNPRGVHVVSFGVPTEEEQQHDFLWRVHKHAPRHGEFSIFNRSQYEDVLVVRVHDLAPKAVWQERYEHIRSFEECLVEHNTIVLKFFLHISQDEQKERLIEREKDATKAWKLNPGDWKERRYWAEYTAAYHDVISKCATPKAPWYVVPADKKWFRNLAIAEAIVAELKPYRDGWLETLAERGKIGRAALKAYKAKHKEG